MKIIVAVKRVVDYKARVRIKADGSDVDISTVKMSMNPFDEIAVEEAIRLKEQGKASEVVVVSIGNASVKETIRTALAMGADRGIHIQSETYVEPLAAAKLLKAVQEKEQAGMVILGKQAIDTDNNQAGQMLAALMNCAQGTFASEVKIVEDRVLVTREIDGGLETLSLKMPCVITTDLRLNEPRYIALPNIVKAKKKQLDELNVSSLGVDVAPRNQLLKVSMPERKRAGKRFESTAELVNCLKNEAQVI